MLKPGTLFAEEDSRDFIGGLPSGWSPQGAGALAVSQVSVNITTQPKNNVADSTNNTLGVTATLTGTTTPVPDVSVDSITVLNNQGQPAGAVVLKTTLSDITDGSGKLTVTFQIGKPGAYYIVVWSSVDGQVILPTAKSVKLQRKEQLVWVDTEAPGRDSRPGVFCCRKPRTAQLIEARSR